MPDISYDLTGDGHVSTKEYFIASKFDKNHDGILDPEERAACIKALKSGYEDNFKFGLDGTLAATQAGQNQTDLLKARVMQKDGKLIEHEDYSKLYGSTVKPQSNSLTDRCKTFSNLREKRKTEAR